MPATFSARKFDEHDNWHYLTAPLKLVFGVVFHRAGAERFAERYWYGKQREGEKK